MIGKQRAQRAFRLELLLWFILPALGTYAALEALSVTEKFEYSNELLGALVGSGMALLYLHLRRGEILSGVGPRARK